MNEFKIISDWHDSLIWCPSQCELKIKYKGKNYILYLRWRNSDPWTASLIPVDKQFSSDSCKDWIRLDIPFFTDEQLDECKVASIQTAKKVLDGLQKEKRA